jgi:glycosyltransferase involved in cell wall biosynthesis
MCSEFRISFAFLVLTYNHQNYILEHLESIKYLVQTYGADLDIDLIINNDCSKDKTQELVNQWLKINAVIFRNIKTINNPVNLGTCLSVNNMLDCVVADRCKITAGDDVYSYENIFELTQHGSDIAMMSGRALYLYGDSIQIDRLSDALTTMTQVVYRDNSLIHRFKHFSYNNAPNILYAKECVLHSNVREYLQKFDVTEDWPLQIEIARQFPDKRLQLINKVLVYYRRTEGSTFIVANKRFINDKNKIFDDLIVNEKNIFERIRLKSRKFCFNLETKVLKKILNIDLYLFVLISLIKIGIIYLSHREIRINLNTHKKHYLKIKQRAQNFEKKIYDEPTT